MCQEQQEGVNTMKWAPGRGLELSLCAPDSHRQNAEKGPRMKLAEGEPAALRPFRTLGSDTVVPTIWRVPMSAWLNRDSNTGDACEDKVLNMYADSQCQGTWGSTRQTQLEARSAFDCTLSHACVPHRAIQRANGTRMNM